MNNLRFREKHKKGIGLVECLVALALISITVASTISITAKNFKSHQLAKQYIFVSNHVGMLAAIIRANPESAKLNNFQLTGSALSGPAIDCVLTQCDQSALAKYTVKSWLDDIPDFLGEPIVNVYPFNGETISISVQWDNDNSGSVGTNCPPVNENDLDCYKIDITL